MQASFNILVFLPDVFLVEKNFKAFSAMLFCNDILAWYVN